MDAQYYFVNIPKGFFNRNDIVYLQSLEHGTDALLVYLKLMLGSSKTYGVIQRAERRIHCLIDMDYEVIRRTIPILEKYGLLVGINEDYFRVKDTNQDTVFVSKDSSGRDRNSAEYRGWRDAVFKRDMYACQRCGKIGVRLNAHHIKPWAKFADLRFDVDNGITLCEGCHKYIHKKMRGNTNGRTQDVCEDYY